MKANLQGNSNCLCAHLHVVQDVWHWWRTTVHMRTVMRYWQRCTLASSWESLPCAARRSPALLPQVFISGSRFCSQLGKLRLIRETFLPCIPDADDTCPVQPEAPQSAQPLRQPLPSSMTTQALTVHHRQAVPAWVEASLTRQCARPVTEAGRQWRPLWHHMRYVARR